MEGNVISGNLGSGIEVSHTTGTHHNQVVGNSVGTDVTGTQASSYARNTYWAVRLEGAKTCGQCPDDAGYNTVRSNTLVNSGNGGMLIDKGQHDNVVSDNRIGVLPNGTVAGNASYGIRIGQGGRKNVIGPGNQIVGNGAGIQIQPNATEPLTPTTAFTARNRITNNVIRGNAGLGIDLYPYGAGGQPVDSLVNEGVAAPRITSATTTAISGTTCGNCRVEVYRTDTTSVTAYGEGAALLGTATAATSGSFRVSVSAPAGTVVTATTTTPGGSTSEFGRNAAVR